MKLKHERFHAHPNQLFNSTRASVEVTVIKLIQSNHFLENLLLRLLRQL